MGSMVDIIFYNNKVGLQNVIEGYKNIVNAPNVGERVIVNEECYKVISRLFDYDSNTIHIVLEKLKVRYNRG